MMYFTTQNVFYPVIESDIYDQDHNLYFFSFKIILLHLFLGKKKKSVFFSASPIPLRRNAFGSRCVSAPFGPDRYAFGDARKAFSNSERSHDISLFLTFTFSNLMFKAVELKIEM